MRLAMSVAVLACLIAGARADASGLEPKSATLELKDFRFEDGERLPVLTLHYLTLGTPRHDASGAIDNAVLLLHGTTGSAQNFLAPPFEQSLYGAGEPLDLTRDFLVIPDGIGTGGSSKPSDGMQSRFPHYGYGDQIRAQHALVRVLGIRHLRMVLGTSMGGMQTWMWAERFPDEADVFVPIAATPAQISGRNEVWRDMIVQAIRNDPDWHGGDYPANKPPHGWLRTAMPLFSIMTTTAEVMQHEAPTRRAAIEFVKTLEAHGQQRDADDTLYLFESSQDYDPDTKLDAVVAPVLTINFEGDLLNPPSLLRLPRAANYTHVLVPTAIGYGHETLAHPEIWAPYLKAFLAKHPSTR